MLRNALTMILIGGSLAIAACNTVRGAGEDVPVRRQLHRGYDEKRPMLSW